MPDYPNDYYWFKDEGNHLIGIKKNIPTSEKNCYPYYLMRLSLLILINKKVILVRVIVIWKDKITRDDGSSIR